MCFAPLEDQLAGAGWQATDNHLQRLDVEGAFVGAVNGMEVRPAMMALVVVHRDHDPVEAADPRHRGQCLNSASRERRGNEAPGATTGIDRKSSPRDSLSHGLAP